jgi:hypothetical protein
MRVPTSAVVIAVLAAFAVAQARATPLAYNEAVSGDLPEGSPFPVLPLDVGVNTVTGTSFVNFPSGGPNSADFDSFEFSVPTNTQLVGITYASTVTNDTSGDTTLRMEAFVDDVPITKSFACQEFYIINKTSIGPTCLVPPGNTFAAALPLDAGTYLLFEGQFQATNFGETDWNYTWSLTVDPVPEPGSIAVLSAGLLMLGAIMWRRRSDLTA